MAERAAQKERGGEGGEHASTVRQDWEKEEVVVGWRQMTGTIWLPKQSSQTRWYSLYSVCVRVESAETLGPGQGASDRRVTVTGLWEHRWSMCTAQRGAALLHCA